MDIWERYQAIEHDIEIELQKAGRPAGSARLLAVSKTKPLSQILALAAHGVTAFGENRVQELAEKVNACEAKLEWHLIGHLQRNKVRQLLKLPVALIHSVDSLRLAHELEKEAEKGDKQVNILVEVNIGGEESKSGVDPEQALTLVREIAGACPHLSIQGLMCVAPEKEDPEQVRPYFRGMRDLRDTIEEARIPGVSMKELSMGMSGDYRVALEEGATIIRVGTAIFGART